MNVSVDANILPRAVLWDDKSRTQELPAEQG
jgi:hypothetical protein